MKNNFDLKLYFTADGDKPATEEYWQNKLDCYSKCIHDLADFMCEKHFGFVSKYAGKTYLERTGLFPVEELGEAGVVESGSMQKIWQKRENDKIERINGEYRAAEQIATVLKPIWHIQKHEIKQPNEALNKKISDDLRRILDACIRKGYQFPAMALVQNMALGRVICGSEEDIKNYLIKIEKNYAIKCAYGDKATYLKGEYLFPGLDERTTMALVDRYRTKYETSDKEFISFVASGEYGPSINGEDRNVFAMKLRVLFNKIYKIAAGNESICRNKVADDEENGI